MLAPAPVLMLAVRSLHSYAFGPCARIANANLSLGKGHDALESFC